MRKFELEMVARTIYGESASIREVRRDQKVQVCVFLGSAKSPILATVPVYRAHKREAYEDLMQQLEAAT